MDRYNADRDKTLIARSPHTYTPKSHEDLLRSQLQLDAAKNARLRNDLQRLADENNRLRRDLGNAEEDIKKKNDEIDNLKKNLGDRPRTLPLQEHPPPTTSPPNNVFEIDGKPVTLDEILNHFEGVIKKHHDLLDKKNQRIKDLEDALGNRPKEIFKPTRNAETQSSQPIDNKQDQMNDLAKELALIRKEYEQVERILTERNNKLENMIEDLKRKLDQYTDEIERLRKELAAREFGNNESNMVLIKEKEKENAYLKNLINSLKNQPTNTNVMLPASTNEELENEIKRIIEDKKNAVHKLSNMILELKKTPSGKVERGDMTDVEKECHAMMGDLNNMNDKLNNVLIKIQRTQGEPVQGDPLNKEDILHNLNNLKKQCEDEIETLKNQIKSPTETPRVVRQTSSPDILRRIYPNPENEPELLNEPVNIDYPQPSILKIFEPTHTYSPTPESSLKSFKPVGYKSVTPPERSYRHLPDRPKSRLYPELPIETRSFPLENKPYVPGSCEACQGDYPAQKPIHPHPVQVQNPTPPYKPIKKKQDKPKKNSCCAPKGSKTSNVPYSKRPSEERVIHVHRLQQPESKHNEHPKSKNRSHSPQQSPKTPEASPKPKIKMVSKLKPDR